MQRATILARFCVKAGFFPQEEADSILQQYTSSPDANTMTFEAWAVAKGYLGVVQARSAVEMLSNSRFRCLSCGKEVFGRQFKVDGNRVACPYCSGEEFRMQGAAAATDSGPLTQTPRASRAPQAPRLGEEDGALPDSFEDFDSGEFGVNMPDMPDTIDPAFAGGGQDAFAGGDSAQFPNAAFNSGGDDPFGNQVHDDPFTTAGNSQFPTADFGASTGHSQGPGGVQSTPGSGAWGDVSQTPAGPGAWGDPAQSSASGHALPDVDAPSSTISPEMLDRGLPEGALLEGIRITKVVGRGGIGIVYKGTQLQLDRQVALKVLSANVLKDGVQRSRFQLEAKSAAKMEHPNIVQVYTFGELFGRPYLVMQWVDGESLGQMIDNRGAMPVERVIDWARQSAKGLHHAHAHGVVHRDVKPDNLIVSTSGQVKIVDFGLAKQKTSELNLSDPNFVLGTPAYIAPEQALGQPIDARTDIYSLAITLYHALTGEIPFDGPAGTVVHKHIQTPLPSPREKVPSIPESLDRLVREMAAKVPNQRPKDMEEVAARLEEIHNNIKNRKTGAGRDKGFTDIVDKVFSDAGFEEESGAASASRDFQPIEEIEYQTSDSARLPQSLPDISAAASPPGAAAATAAPPDALPEAAPSRPRQPLSGSPASASQIEASGLKGRRSRASTGSEAALRATSRINVVGVETQEAKLKRTGLRIITLFVVVTLLLGGFMLLMSRDLIWPEYARRAQLIERARDSTTAQSRELARQMEQFSDEFPSLAEDEEFRDAYSLLQGLIDDRDKELIAEEAKAHLARVKARTQAVNDAILKSETYTNPDDIDSNARLILGRLIRAINDAEDRLRQARQFDKEHDNLGEEFDGHAAELEETIERGKGFATRVRSAIDRREADDAERDDLVNRARALFGRIDRPLEGPLPEHFPIERAQRLREELDQLFTRVPRLRGAEEMTQIDERVNEALGLAQAALELSNLLRDLDGMPVEGMLETIVGMRNDPDANRRRLYGHPDVQARLERAREIIVERQERFFGLRDEVRPVLERPDPRRHEVAKDLHDRLVDFRAIVPRMHIDELTQMIGGLARIVEQHENNDSEFDLLNTRAGDIRTPQQAQELLDAIEDFARRVDYIDVTQLREQVIQARDNAEIDAQRRHEVEELRQRAGAAEDADQARSFLDEIDRFLTQEGYGVYAQQFSDVRDQLQRLIAWQALQPPPYFDGFPWQLRDVIGNEAFLLEEVIGDYRPPGHAGAIRSIRYSPDGRWMVTAGNAGNVRLWDAGQDVEIRSFRPGSGGPALAVFHSDKLFIATDTSVYVIDAASREQVARLSGHLDAITDLDVSPDGRYVATASLDNKVRVFDLANPGSNPKDFRHADDVYAVRFAPRSAEAWERESTRRVVTGTRDRKAVIWNWNARATHELPCAASVTCLAITPDGQKIATGCADGTAKIWALFTGAVMATLQTAHGSRVNDIAFSAGSRVVSGSADGTIALWDIVNGEVYRTIDGRIGDITALAFTPDQTGVVAGSVRGAMRRWSLSGQMERLPDAAHVQRITGMAFTEAHMVTTSADTTSRTWLRENGRHDRRMILTGEQRPLVGCVAVDASHVVVLTVDGRVFFCDARIARFDDDQIDRPDGFLAASGCAAVGSRMLVADAISPRLLVVDLEARAVVDRVALPTRNIGVSAVAVSPDGRYYAAGTRDGEVMIGDLRSMEHIRTLSMMTAAVTSLAFSPDSARLLVGCSTGSGSRGETYLVDVGEQRTLRIIGPNGNSPVSTVAFIADGTSILIATEDGTIRRYAADNPGDAVASITLATSGDFATLLRPREDGRLLVGTARGVVLVFRLG